jgi:hypothetical protein
MRGAQKGGCTLAPEVFMKADTRHSLLGFLAMLVVLGIPLAVLAS